MEYPNKQFQCFCSGTRIFHGCNGKVIIGKGSNSLLQGPITSCKNKQSIGITNLEYVPQRIIQLSLDDFIITNSHLLDLLIIFNKSLQVESYHTSRLTCSVFFTQ